MVLSVQQLVPLIVCLQFGVVQVVDSKFIRAFFTGNSCLLQLEPKQ